MKRAVVTGASSGIGEAIARGLAARGMTVVMVGRDEQRLNAARDRVLAAVPGADLVLDRTDLALLEEVRALAKRLAEPAPDVVISNAAVIAPVRERTPEGLSHALATNHLAPYLLLRSLAESTRPARFVVVGAEPRALSAVPVDLDDLSSENEATLDPNPAVRPFAAYGRTKNMNAMFVYALARRLDGTGITVNGAHPGVIGGTGLGRNLSPEAVQVLFSRVNLDPASRPGPDVGADTPLWLATAPELEGVTGRFFVERQEVPTADHTTDVARCDRLWLESARLTGLKP